MSSRIGGALDGRLVLAVGAAALALLVVVCLIGYRATVKSISLRLIEEHNVALAMAVARELEAEFAELLRDTGILAGSGTDDLATAIIAANEFRLQALLQDAHVHYFDIHDLSGRAIYTSHPDGMGSDHAGEPDFEAARAGAVTNHLDSRPADAAGTAQPHIHLVTFAPIRSQPQGAALGVLGLYAIADSGAEPDLAARPLIAAAFAVPPLALLLLGGGYAYRRSRNVRPARDTPGDDGARCHTITAQETERKRISRDLHDGIGQYLSAIKIHLQHIATDRDNRLPVDTREEIEGVARFVANASDEVRRISLALRPTMLDDLGLLATVNWLCREFSVAHPDIVLRKHVALEEQDIPEALKTAAYRILQESLTNVAKHSHATRVDVMLEKAGDDKQPVLKLTVADDGQGFNPCETCHHQREGSGVGLHSMRERAETSGGELYIHSQKKAGTRIQALWPLA